MLYVLFSGSAIYLCFTKSVRETRNRHLCRSREDEVLSRFVKYPGLPK